jgi:hypothetical protein
VRSCTGWSSNRPNGPCSTITPIVHEDDPVCDMTRMQYLVGHDDHRHSGLCHAANDAQHLACQLMPSLVVAAAKRAGR